MKERWGTAARLGAPRLRGDLDGLESLPSLRRRRLVPGVSAGESRKGREEPADSSGRLESCLDPVRQDAERDEFSAHRRW